ncbi:DUF342 domain-containing protein [Brumicola nitratireducens]|uniref:Flagellar Assembly Protein A N-terminal region domain-containing protein n=1 Tax=Glaciecola nitratireducens (strain JCM 12485 / KCTC 12276 / FR1064) TaxID=1085623 RepID=G4QLF1_GLANF|nr:FapA family protein [Glaciecola nitratireducens]AEP29818.1 hypothetical protein GNIT_1702 [Glaciecola nitratireducens FR1064]
MKGLTLTINKAAKQLIATIDPLLVDDFLQPEAIEAFIHESEYKQFFILNNAIASLCEQSNAAKKSKNSEELHQAVGEIRDASVTVTVSNDQMSVEMTIESPYSGSVPTYEELLALLRQKGVNRGISKKRIKNLLFQASEADSGIEFTGIVAIGLPAKDGKPSRLKSLFPNALDRILQPQEAGNNKVNMRNLGDILCVQAKIAVAKREPPGKGRAGYTVTDSPLSPIEGQWIPIKLGANTSISPQDENIILAEVSGQPKFENDIMNVDNTFQTKGVNVGTGNINYDGAVIVNGDVTESMEVIAKGDITINGFVESATIRAGGDIIITEGAMGKMNEEDCKLHAKGSVFVQHGQGLDIVANKNLNVRKQLAYSRVKCGGIVTIGEPDRPMGNLFASTIQCGSTLYAGTVGAVSGSSLIVDFSESVNTLNARYEAVLTSLKQLRENNFDHQIKLRELHAKHVPNGLLNQLNKIDAVFESEKHLLKWLETVEQDLRQAKIDFEKNARVVAHKELFPGVSIKMNKRHWRSEKEYLKSVVSLEEGKWQHTPLIN